MTIAIGSAPSDIVGRFKFEDFMGRDVTKTTAFDGTTDDTHLLQIITDMDVLSNARIIHADFNKRLITGLKSSATDSVNYGMVAQLLELTFTKTNPVNALKVATRSFLLPAPVDGIVDSDGKPIVGTSGTDTDTNRLARLIVNLQTYLNYLGADGTWYPGSFVFSLDESALVTVPSV